jgi:hypothetical protein
VYFWSTDSDYGWKRVYIPTDDDCDSSSTFLTSDELGKFLVLVAGTSILRSVNFGQSWTYLSNRSHIATGLNNSTKYTSAVCDGSGQVLLLCGTVGNSGENIVYMSYDSGYSWSIPAQPNYNPKYKYSAAMSKNGLFMALAASQGSTSAANIGYILTSTNTNIIMYGRIQPTSHILFRILDMFVVHYIYPSRCGYRI